MAACLSGKNDGRIHDVRRVSSAEKLSDGARALVLERLDDDTMIPEQPSKARLATPVAPNLCNDRGRYADLEPVFERSTQERDDAPIGALERNQSARVQRESAHAERPLRRTRAERLGFKPSARSAQRCS